MSRKRSLSSSEVDDEKMSESSFTESEDNVEKRLHSSTTTDSEQSDDDGQLENGETTMFTNILNKLSKAVNKKDASELLHSIAASKSIIFWTKKGELLHHDRRIPVTSMAKLVEYTLLPYNSEISRPRGLNTFIDGISEIDINKKLVKNKALLPKIILREKEFEEQGETDSEESTTSGTESEEADEREPGDESDDSQMEETSDEDNNGDEDNVSCENCASSDIHKIIVVRCPICQWYDGFHYYPNMSIACDICRHSIPMNFKQSLREAIKHCEMCGYTVHTNLKTGHRQTIQPDNSDNKQD